MMEDRKQSIAEQREVYRSRCYNPDQVRDEYAKENRIFEEGGFRVVEVNIHGQTIREYVTQSAAQFNELDIRRMKERADSGMSPSWTLLGEMP